MTTLASSTLFLNTVNSTTGILLNSRSRSSPNRHPSSIASSSSSHSTHSHSCSPSSNDGEGTRKIRFAPLPAPRRDELPCVFYESDSDSQLLHNVDSPPSPITAHTEDSAPKLKSRTWGKLLRPLLHPLIPSAPNGDDNSYLLRISSRDSAPNDDSLCAPLTRRMSTGSRVVPTREAERWVGVPLAPVMSEGSASKGRKDGQRMLNGRVYGRRLSAVNHHQASYEPEFVEWGYGGMGSVSSGAAKSRSGPDWAKLQSTGKVLGADDRVDNEGDDGSGMGWVKRRRAQREREQREKEESEKAAQNGDAVPDINVHSPAHVGSGSKPEEHHHIYRAVSIPAPHHHIRHHSHHKSGEGSGTVTPTSIPPLSRAGSSNSVPLVRTASSGSTIPFFRTPSSGSPVPLFRTPSSGSAVPLFRTSSSGSHGDALLPMPENNEASSASPAASNASIDEDSSSEDENDTERDSDEDDDNNEVEGRITSKGAGVEKISRHKE